MTNKIGWGILSTGSIAGTFARGVAASRTGRLVAVGSRSQKEAERFGEAHGIAKRHSSYEALLADPEVEAVYIATPHPMHSEWAVKAAEAGKHILCEKPITLNSPEAMSVVEAARANGVFLMEAYMYRCHPQTALLAKLVEEGSIGEVRLIQAEFSFHGGFDPQERHYNRALGGGGILDVGGYCVTMIHLVAGAALKKRAVQPKKVSGMAYIGTSGVDEYAAASLEFEGNILAQLATGVSLNLENKVKVYGSKGHIVVHSPWFCDPGTGNPHLTVHRSGQAPEAIRVDTDRSLYAYEADIFAEGMAQGEAPAPAMSTEETVAAMRTLDRWRQSAGMFYDHEAGRTTISTASGRPLAKKKNAPMLYGKLTDIEKPVARFIMGTMLEGSILARPHAYALWDHYFEQGGNAFDTAYIYFGGESERILGKWCRDRGVREQITVVGKGVHTPYCTPEYLTSQLSESLDRMQMDYVDLYLMHRDNPEIPAGEFVEVLNQHKKAGRMRAFGGSNWSIERVQEANDYAAAHGLTGFTAVSNNFSLARMVQPIWGGCISSSDAVSREWFTRTQIPILSWSSQARGFFVRGNAGDTSDEELVRVWHCDDNFERLKRARELAEKKGVKPIEIAAAYLFAQPFPVYALIGPQSPSETASSLKALSIELTPEEVKWLNLEDQ